MKRKIIKIDENKCTGCGMCVPDCPEGAIRIINGKARLVSESLCDGLGACVGRCPTGALTVEEREVEKFDEQKAKLNMEKHGHEEGCPGMKILEFGNKKPGGHGKSAGTISSALGQWPIQLKLLNPNAPYFKNADLVVAADCVPFSYPDFHGRFLEGKTLIIFCPKLDNSHEEYIEKMAEIFKNNDIKSVTVVHMEVPCCSGTTKLVDEALKISGKNIVIKDYTISLQGEIV